MQKHKIQAGFKAQQASAKSTAAGGGKPQFSPLFPHEKWAAAGCGKLRAAFFQSGEDEKSMPVRTVKREEKTSTFFFIKGKVPTFLPRNWHELRWGITACISRSRISCGKPGGKSGKPRGKLGFFFTKTVENLVEKVKNSLRNGILILFLVVEQAAARLHFAVRAGSFPRRGAHRAGVPVFS